MRPVALQPVGVAAHDDVRSGPGEAAGERPLIRARAALELDPPVEEDDDGVRRPASFAYRPQEARHVLRGGEPGLSGPGGPGADQVVVEHLRRAEDRDALAVDCPPVRRVRLSVVAADPDDREAVAPGRRERVAEAGLP